MVKIKKLNTKNTHHNIMLSVFFCRVSFMLSVAIKPNMLSVFMPNVVMLSVLAPPNQQLKSLLVNYWFKATSHCYKLFYLLPTLRNNKSRVFDTITHFQLSTV